MANHKLHLQWRAWRHAHPLKFLNLERSSNKRGLAHLWKSGAICKVCYGLHGLTKQTIPEIMNHTLNHWNAEEKFSGNSDLLGNTLLAHFHRLVKTSRRTAFVTEATHMRIIQNHSKHCKTTAWIQKTVILPQQQQHWGADSLSITTGFRPMASSRNASCQAIHKNTRQQSPKMLHVRGTLPQCQLVTQASALHSIWKKSFLFEPKNINQSRLLIGNNQYGHQDDNFILE